MMIKIWGDSQDLDFAKLQDFIYKCRAKESIDISIGDLEYKGYIESAVYQENRERLLNRSYKITELKIITITESINKILIGFKNGI